MHLRRQQVHFHFHMHPPHSLEMEYETVKLLIFVRMMHSQTNSQFELRWNPTVVADATPATEFFVSLGSR